MSPRTPSLEERFLASLAALGVAGAEAHVLAAVSGGVDSVVLLHLLRFAAAETGVAVSAAHFDHAMRPDSAADARWVAGLCRAWGVPILSARSDEVLAGEAAARDARYRFLREAQAQAGATHLATGHHADDQAETVLFRVLRGTGPAGLAGIPPRGDAGLVRPLLPFWRAEIRRYARAHGLAWREDPTNASGELARNRLRRQVLPMLERTVAPGARRALARLAELAREDEAAWEALLRKEMDEVAHEDEGALVLVRDRLAGYDSAVAARVLRGVLRRRGIVLDRTGTRSALQFITAAPSGRTLELPGGAVLRTEFGAVRVERAADPPPPDRPLAVEGERGEGALRLAGRELRAAWTTGDGAGADTGDGTVSLPAEGLRLPLLLRGWMPGDRVRTPGGTKSLKKLFGERRVPRRERHRTPVLADAGGRVLWVAGLARALPAPRDGERVLTITIADA